MKFLYFFLIYPLVVNASFHIGKKVPNESLNFSPRVESSSEGRGEEIESSEQGWKPFIEVPGFDAFDEFGEIVSISRDGFTVAGGARRNALQGENSGQVIVVDLAEQNSPKSVTFYGDEEEELFGKGLALSEDGRTLAIGAFQSGNKRGRVEVWRYTSSDEWRKAGNDIIGVADLDKSGVSISISNDGKTLAIGAHRNDGDGKNSVGHVRVLNFDGTDWSLLGDEIIGENEGDLSGRSVELSGDGSTVIVGAAENDGNGYNSGHARVYTYNRGVWGQVGFDIDGETPFDESGGSVSISEDGKIIAIGARFNDGNKEDDGHVRVYRYRTNWEMLGDEIIGKSANDESGQSVSLSSDGLTVAIGAAGDSEGDSDGRVRIYRFSSNRWSKIAQKRGSDNGRFGASVSLSGNGGRVAVGEPFINAKRGYLKVYDDPSLRKPVLVKQFRDVLDDVARLTVLVSDAHRLFETVDVDVAWNHLFEDGGAFSIAEKVSILNIFQKDADAAGIDPTADDAILQLKSARLILEMKAEYEKLEDENKEEKESKGEFAESGELLSNGSVRPVFLNSKTAALTKEMKNVEAKIADDVDEGYSYLFETNESVSVEEKVDVLTAVLDNIIEAGLDISATDALLQLQSTICVLEMLRIYNELVGDEVDNSSNDLDSYIAKEDWKSAEELVKNPVSFSEAMGVLPTAASKFLEDLLAKGDMYEVEKQLDRMRKEIEVHLMDITVEKHGDEVEFSYVMLDFLDFLRKEAPHNTKRSLTGSY